MIRLFCSALLGSFFALAGCTGSPAVFSHAMHGEDLPWTHTSFDTDNGRFMFAVFSDLYGGEREGVFAIAMEQLQLLRPEFILNVGDLIDGGTEDRDRLTQEWDEFDGKIAGMHAPVFYIGGNHDLTNLTMRDFWEGRYGARYYHFVYRNVLFLMMDSEDYTDERMQEIYAARAHALKVMSGEIAGDPSETEYFNMPERRTGAVREQQAAYFRKVIAENPDVRWTFVLMHKPLWRNDQATEFRSIETALKDRPYTVINGHFHSYSLTKRHGRDYIHLGTTSGAQAADDPMSFDHVTLVTMTRNGPSIANLRLDGILDSSGHVPLNGDDACFQASACAAENME